MKIFMFLFLMLFSFSTHVHAEPGYIYVFEGKVLVTSTAYELDVNDKNQIEVFTENGKFTLDNNEDLKILSGNVELKFINNGWYFKPVNSNVWLKMPSN